jgi:hypothetical protein
MTKSYYLFFDDSSDVLSSDVWEKEIKGKISEELFGGKPVEVCFYKLALYEQGGHFASHRDTSHSDDHLGTLLVEVPSPHTGGRLVLEPAFGGPPHIEGGEGHPPSVTWDISPNFPRPRILRGIL